VAIDPCKIIENGVASKLFLLADHLEMTAGYKKEDPELRKNCTIPKSLLDQCDNWLFLGVFGDLLWR
jgi:hypothetical protein